MVHAGGAHSRPNRTTTMASSASSEREVYPAEHSVGVAESNLAEDAAWKKIQKNTFTRWCNEHLRCVERQIRDLQHDLNDGLTLIALLEVLSHKKMFRKFHARPTFRQMRLDNVSVALEFLDQENIRLVSIDSKAIVDGNMKLILGLVWTLILHYSISTPLMDTGGAKKLTPELRLLGWIQEKVPDMPITNFSHDWMDGKALGALVDGLAPGLCPDWESWDEVQRVDNAREAMQQADEWLGVPQVIAPEEIMDPGVDEQSIMTYLSMFPKAQLKPGAPLKPRSVSKPKACRASGRGLQPRGVRVGQTACIKVDTCRAGPGELEVHVRRPDGSDVPVTQKEDTEGIYLVQYEPDTVGDHTIAITWAGEDILKSPFAVAVGPRAGPQFIRAWGPGLEHGIVDLSADFVVESTGTNAGMLGIAIEGPSQARIECKDHDDGSCDVKFWPTKPGDYAVHVTCDEDEIQDSPFMSHISPNKKKCFPHKVKVFGKGVSEQGFILNTSTEFTVDARFAGDGTLSVQAQSRDGAAVKVETVRKDTGLYSCYYTPTALLKHTIFVAWGGVCVPGSPFSVTAGRIRIEPVGSRENGEVGNATSPSKLDLTVTSPVKTGAKGRKVLAYGPGLDGGFVGVPAEFVIDTNDCGSGQLSVTVQGPTRPARFKCCDNEDGTCTVTYLPAENGEHSVNVLFRGAHIPGSPFHVDIHLPFDPSKVVVSGPEVKKGKVGEPCVVTINCDLAGLSDLSVEAVSECGQKVETKLVPNQDGTYTVVYVPLTAGIYTLRLKYGEKVLANLPSKVIVDPAVYKSQVKLCGNGDDRKGKLKGQQKPATSVVANGIGLLQGITGESNHFTVTTRNGGAAGIAITVEGPSDANVSCTESKEGRYDVQYTPSVPGLYEVNITQGGEHITGSPFQVPVKDASDKRDVQISGEGLESGVCANVPQTFTIDCSKTGEAPESVAVMTPSGKIELVEVKDNGDGTYSLAYSPSMAGDHSLVVKYADEDAFSNPIAFKVLPSKDANQVKVALPGLESGVCAMLPQTFTVDCSETGEAPESVAVMTPDGKMEVVPVTDNGDGTYSVPYTPSMDGAHSLVVKYADEEEFRSPIAFKVLPSKDANQVKVALPGLESGVCAMLPQTFTVDCSETGEAPESVAVMTPDGKMEVVPVTDNGDGTYSVPYTPSMDGAHSLVVKYADEEEFRSPIAFKVLPSKDANQVKVALPGLESGVCAMLPQTFTVDCSETGEAPESVAVMTPDGKMEVVPVTDNGDGTYSVPYTPSMDGAHSLVVKYADEEEFRSPVEFQVLPTNDAKALQVSCPGLESGACSKAPQTFTIACSKTGESPECVAVMTPHGKMELVEVTDNGDGTYSVAYSPSMEGPHSLVVKYTDEEEFNRPFDFNVVESGQCLLQAPQTFTVDCSKTGEPPEFVAVRTPSGRMELVPVTDNGDGTYSVVYTPSLEGAHSVIVKYADDDEFVSPHQFQVLPGDSSKKVKVPGLESGVCAQIPQTFTIDCSETGETPESVAVMTPSGKIEMLKVTKNSDGTCSVAFSPSMDGAHSVMVKYADDDEFKCLSNFQVLPTNDANEVSGPGLESGVCAKVPQTFTIDCSKTGESPECVAVMTPDGKMELVEVSDNGDGTYSITYTPSTEGAHSLVVKYSDEDEFCSPHQFQVLPGDSSKKVKVSVPGLESGVCAKIPQTFTIDCSETGETPESVAVMTPSGKIEVLEVTKNSDGTCSVAFSPSMDGAHSVMVKYADDDEFKSLSDFQVLPTNDANELRVSGPGLESGVCAKVPQTFTIDCSKTGESPECVAVMTPDGKMELVEVSDNGDGTYSITYTPSTEGAHSLVVKYSDEDEFCSPHQFQVLPGDSSKKVSVPGLESGVCAQIPQTFTIDCSKTGETPESVAVMTPSGKMEMVKVTDNGDGTYSVPYSPSMEGAHSVMVKYNGDEDFSCLSNFQVLPTNDANKLDILDPRLKAGVCAQIPQTFTIGCNKTGEIPQSVAVMTPNGKMELVEVTDNGDGTYSVSYSPSVEGAHSLLVKYADEDEFCSPHQFQVLPGDSSKKVKVSVPGLESGVCAQIPQTFTIDCSETGETPESVAVMTPSGKMEMVKVTDNGDGTYSVPYSPSMEGAHSVMVKYNGDEDFSCLSNFQVLPTNDANKLDILDPRLKAGVCAQIPQTFTIGCNKTGEIPQSVAVMTPNGKMELVEVTDNGDGTYSVSYSPSVEGAHSLLVKYADDDEFCSPHQFQVLPGDSSKKVEVSVPGLESGVCAQIPQTFTIDCSETGETPESVAVMTPSGKMEMVKVTDNGDGTYSVPYSPSMDGAHSVMVKYNGDEDFSCLSNFQVLPTNDANKLNVLDPALKAGVCAQTPQTFTIGCNKSGEIPQSVAVMTPNGKMELVEVTDNGDGTYSVSYSPSVEGAHSLLVKYADDDEFCSPQQFHVLPGDSRRKVKVSVPGLESGVCAQIPQTFTIDCSKTGERPESVAVMTPSGKIEVLEVTKNSDGTCSVAFSPSMDGAHSVMVKYGDDDEFKCLSDFQVLPTNDAHELRVSGPGPESGVCAKVPQTFTIDCSKTGESPECVAVMTPDGKMELVEVSDNGDGTYSITYTPSTEGAHSLVVKYSDEDEFCSPHQFQVLPGDYSKKVKVSVPGLESGVCAQIPQTFTIDCSETGETPESVAVMTPSGKIEVLEVTKNSDGTCSVAFSPSMDGAHSVMVKYADDDEFKCLSDFQVLPTTDAHELRVSGPGLESGVCAKVPQTFTIDCSKTGESPECVAVMTPFGKMELVEVTDNGDGTYSVSYSPSAEGAHSLLVKYADEDEFCSPHQFQVLPGDSSKKVSVPGLESGVCAQIPQTFTIDCSKTGETPESVAVMTPSGKMEMVKVTDNGDGTYSVPYSPSMEGAHSVMVKYNGDEDFSCLSNFQVLPTNDANKLNVLDPALKAGVCAQTPQTFKIGCNKTGEIPQSVAVMTPNGKMELVEVTDNGDGTYSVSYSPSVEGAHSLLVKYADEDEFCSPHQFQVLPGDSSKKVKVSVPGLESGVCAQIPQTFTIDCSETGETPESVAVMTPSGKMEMVKVTDNGDGTYSVPYSPSMEGAHSVMVKYNGDEDFSCLSNFQVLPTNDANKLDILDPRLKAGVCAQIPQTFTIGCNKTGEIPQSVAVMTPNGKMELVEVTDNGDGTYSVSYSPSVEGAHSLLVKYADDDEFCSPHQFQVLPGDSSKKVEVSVPGLESGVCAQIPQTFTIDCSETGETPESVAVMTPSGKMEMVKVTDNGDGTYSVPYSPSMDGAHSVMVKYNGDEDFSCLSNFQVLPTNDANKLNVLDPALKAGVCAQTPQTFTIGCNKSGEIPQSVAVMTPNGKMELVEVTDNGDGTYSVSYSPSVEGAHSLLVKYADDDEFCSPQQFHVLPGDSSKKVKVSVPGLESGVCAQIPQTFTIDCSKTGERPESVAVMTPSGKIEVLEVTKNSDGTCSVAFSPSMDGAHSVMVKYGDDDEFKCLSDFQVLPTNDAHELRVSGPGPESGVCAKVPQTFTIDCSKTGESPECVAVMTPDGKMELVEVSDNGDGTYSITYTPSTEGAHSLVVKYSDEDEFCSPHQFQVLPGDYSKKVKVSVPGLESGVCAQIPQTFTIDCSETGETPESVAVMTPSGKIEVLEVTKNSDGTCSVAFSPSMDGAHSVMVKYADDDEFKCLSDFQVLPTTDAHELRVSGPGLESGVCAKVPQTFTIDCSKTGESPECVAVMTPFGKMELVEVTDNGDGTYSVSYSPSAEGAHSLLVKYADEDEFCSPHQFQVLPGDSSKKVSVPGLESGVCAQIPQTFTIDCSKTGETPESVAVMTPSGKMEMVKVTDNGDGTYSVPYSPSMEGAHSVMVKYNGDEDFSCLSNFQVLPTNDANKLNVLDPTLKAGVCAQTPQTFKIGCNKTGEIPQSVAVMTPNGKMELVEVTDNGDGTYSVSYSPSVEGAHSLLVKYADEDEFCSPHQFQVLPGDSSKKVKVSVPGLESGVCAQIPQTFTIDCSKTGETPESVAVMTPSGKIEVLTVKDNGNGTYSVDYSPSMDGAHSIMVKYGEEDEYSSLSSFQVLPTNDDNKLNLAGSVVESGLCAKVPQTFTIDCSKTGEAPESVAVMTPSGKMELVEVTDNGDGTYSVAYSPSVGGDHSLLVKYAEEEEFCSPYKFHVLPTGASELDASHPGRLPAKTCARVPQTFTIDCKPGEAPVSVAMVLPNGKVELVELRDCGDGKYTVSWCPTMDGSHSLMVKYAHEDRYCSPFQFHVLSVHDAHKVRVSGPGLMSGLPASLPACFSVDTSEAGEGHLSVDIVDPEGRSKRPLIHDNYDGTYEVSYVPDKVGCYKITIEYSGDEIATSPYHVCAIATGDANKCIVTGPELGSTIGAGEEIGFVVNTQSAGMGKVSCFVLTPDGSEVEADVTEKEDGTFEICYTATQPGNYIISASFGGESLFTSPFEVTAQDEDLRMNHGQVSRAVHNASSTDEIQPMMKHGSYIPLSTVNRHHGLLPFDIVMSFGLTDAEIIGEVHMPSGSRAQAEVIDNRDGTVTLTYDPTEEGLHQLHIKVNGATMAESPFQFYVNNASKGELMAHGPGLVYGISNEIAAFTIFNKDLVQGELDIALEGPSRAEIRCLNNRDGTCTVTYLPTVPGDYNVLVRHNEEHITGSPFAVKIAGSCAEAGGEAVGPLRSQVRFGTVPDFTLDITEDDISLLSASITSPSGQDVSCLLKRQPDSHIGISFIPKEVGEHLVSVLKDGQHVANSPIPLTITPLEIGEASRVKVFGPGLTTGSTYEMSDFVVDMREAGYGGLTLAIEGPSMVDIQTEELEDGTCGVSFCPTESGTYSISVKFTDEHVPGSPFKTTVTEGGHKTESITHYQGAAAVAKVGNMCGINLKVPGLDLQHISAEVSGPSGAVNKATVSVTGQDTCSVNFVPKETGVHNVSVKYRGQAIPGSPYHYTVGPLGEGGSHKVQAWGLGLESAEASVPADFSIWAREAGVGELSVAMEGPGRAEMLFEDRKDGACGISYVAPQPGDYVVSVKFNDQHIQDSPYVVPVLPTSGANNLTKHQTNRSSGVPSAWPSFTSDASKVCSSGPGLKRAFIGKKNAFAVDCTDAGTNLLLVGMHGPTFPCEHMTIQHLGDNHYDVSYAVKETGGYILIVKWGDEHIPGSPFHVHVA